MCWSNRGLVRTWPQQVSKYIMHGRITAFLLATLAFCDLQAVPAWYRQQREAILAKERLETVGGLVNLTPEEHAVNQILMAAKHAEINDVIYNSTNYLPSMHFFKARPLMDKSKVFQIIKSMPKGAALHLHSNSITSIEWLVKNVTYRPHCYMCVAQNTIKSTGFYLTPPTNGDCQWLDISSERAKSSDVDAFDMGLYSNFTITVDDPDVAYPNINSVWTTFEDYFDATRGLFDFVPVLKDNLHEAFRQFRDDGVQYLEIRYNQRPYELDGTRHNHSWLLQTYRDVINNFVSDYPDFSGAKFIFSGPKRGGIGFVLQEVKEAMDALQQFPDVFLGFDLVQQEDVTHTLQYYLSDLLYPLSRAEHLPYFFHAGETDWLDIHDNNLIDAVLLNTTRIGHGFALTKHPEVMKMVKERGIAIEVNPISNQILKLVADLRNHPAAILITQDFPICISSDDPAVWEALPLSHDFYMAFMALAGADDDIRFLKQMALNSIKYSAMTPFEKATAERLWQTKWIEFLRHVQDSHSHAGLIG